MNLKFSLATIARKSGILLAVIVSFAPIESASAMLRNPETESAPEGRRVASCILRASSQEELLPLDAEVVYALMTTTTVMGDATRDVLGRGVSEDLEYNYIEVSIETIHDGNLMDDNGVRLLRLQIRLEESDAAGGTIPPRADELLDAIVERLRGVIHDLAKKNDAAIRQRRALAEVRLDLAQKRLHELITKRRAISERANRIDLSRDGLVDEIRSLEDQQRDTSVEKAAQEGRRTAIERIIAATTQRLAASSENDSVVSELTEMQKSLEARMARIRALVENQTASEAELLQAQEPLHELRIRIAERREELAARSGGDDLAALNHELIQLSLASAEVEARNQQIQSRLAEIRPLLPLADELETEVILRLPLAMEAVRRETERVQSLTEAIETMQPAQLDVVSPSDIEKK